MVSYEKPQVSKIFDARTVEYLDNKTQGGNNNEKGNIFENYYAVYHIARLAKDICENNINVNIYTQIVSFIDDLIIEHEGSSEIQHYQLKNKKSVSWGKGLKSISDDFQKQDILNTSLGLTTAARLVVSNQDLRDDLENSMPIAIKDFSKVCYFPYKEEFLQLVQETSDFLEAISYLSAFETPAPDKIECVAKVLLGSWITNHKSHESVRIFLDDAKATTPNYIRAFGIVPDLDLEVIEILDKIEGFNYKVSKGYFHWEYGEADSGTYPFSVDTERFNKFQQIIKNVEPTKFEELEIYL